MTAEPIDFRTLSYELFELTGQKLFDMYDFLVSNPLLVRLISTSKRRQKKKKMHHRATRQETLQRRKIVYRDASGADEEESSEPALVESTSNKPKVSVQEQEKLQKLEDELARLRSEMSRFLNAAQAQQQHSSGDDLEDSMTPQKMNADPEAGFRTPAPTRRSSSVIPQAPPLPGANSAVPPPPPLPVPSTPKSFKKASSDDMDVDDKENQPANNAAAPATPSSQTEPPKPSLAELVRSASSRGSLRRVDGERSPGGTLKRKPSVSSGPASNNHTDVIAHALRMKFKSMHRDSPLSSPDKTFGEETM